MTITQTIELVTNVNIFTPLRPRGKNSTIDFSARGFSYVEVLIATFLIAVTLVPAMEALQPGIQGSTIHKTYTEDRYQIAAKMESILAEPFGVLETAASAAGSATTPTSYSDTVTHPNGRQITRQVYLSLYDGDNSDSDNDPFTGTDPDLIWAKVIIEGTPYAVESLSTRY